MQSAKRILHVRNTDFFLKFFCNRKSKIRISEIKKTEKILFRLFATVYIFDFCKNINPRVSILFLVDKSLT